MLSTDAQLQTVITRKVDNHGLARCHAPVIPEHGRWKQQGQGLQIFFDYVVSLSLAGPDEITSQEEKDAVRTGIANTSCYLL